MRPLSPLRPQQKASEKDGSIHRDLFKWMVGSAKFFGLCVVPPKGIVITNMTAGDVTDYFTGGVGNSGSPYENWAVCDGLNDTPDLTALSPPLISLMRVS